MNRGSESLRDSQVARERASMRPRFMNRGSDAGTLATRINCSCFNEAPIHESGK